jgi:predicted dehydrogenase
LLDASHEIDYVRWLAGEVAGVYALAGKVSNLEMDAEDTAALVLRFHARTIGEIHLDCVQRGYSRRCVLIGSEATVRWDAMSGLTITSAGGATTQEALVPQPNDTYVAEMKAFLDGDVSWHASLADGRRVVDVVLAARQSAAARREIAL